MCDAVCTKGSKIFTTNLVYLSGKKIAVLECCGKMKLRDSNREIRLLRAAWDGNYSECASLLSKKMDPDEANTTGLTALMCAARWGHFEICELLLQHGANPNIQDEDGNTALLAAVATTQTAVCELLLSKKADPNLSNHDGLTPLLSATWSGNLDICSLLINNDANPSIINKNGWSPLWMASKLQKFQLVKLFKQYDEDSVDETSMNKSCCF